MRCSLQPTKTDRKRLSTAARSAPLTQDARDGGKASVGGLNVFMPMGHESSEDAVKRVLPVLQETARAMRSLTL